MTSKKRDTYKKLKQEYEKFERELTIIEYDENGDPIHDAREVLAKLNVTPAEALLALEKALEESKGNVH